MSRVEDGIKALSQSRPTFVASWHTHWAPANLTQRTVSPADARNLKIFHSIARYDRDETLATTDAARRDAERSGSPRNSVAFINGPTTSGAGVRRRAAGSLHHVYRRVNTAISTSRRRSSSVCLRLGELKAAKQAD